MSAIHVPPSHRTVIQMNGDLIWEQSRKSDKHYIYRQSTGEKILVSRYREDADYTQVIKMEPNFADVYFNRGSVRKEKGDRRGAIADYNQAIKIDPDYAYAYVARGYIRSEKGEK